MVVFKFLQLMYTVYRICTALPSSVHDPLQYLCCLQSKCPFFPPTSICSLTVLFSCTLWTPSIPLSTGTQARLEGRSKQREWIKLLTFRSIPFQTEMCRRIPKGIYFKCKLVPIIWIFRNPRTQNNVCLMSHRLNRAKVSKKFSTLPAFSWSYESLVTLTFRCWPSRPVSPRLHLCMGSFEGITLSSFCFQRNAASPFGQDYGWEVSLMLRLWATHYIFQLFILLFTVFCKVLVHFWFCFWFFVFVCLFLIILFGP